MSYHDHGLYASASRRTNDNDVVLEDPARLGVTQISRVIEVRGAGVGGALL